MNTRSQFLVKGNTFTGNGAFFDQPTLTLDFNTTATATIIVSRNKFVGNYAGSNKTVCVNDAGASASRLRMALTGNTGLTPAKASRTGAPW